MKTVKMSVEKQILKAIEEYMNYFSNDLKLCQNTNLVQMAEQMIWNEMKNVYYWGKVGAKS